MSKPLSTQALQTKLEKELEASHVQVVDVSDGCGQAFEVVVVSPKFEGLSLLKRHKLVNEAVKHEIEGIHAFSQKTFTPSQWQEQSK
ncbi:hypothetical protein HDV03_005349 [Kappamyces sp. JEL0829]|nr:hypothetical protein HDV03_005349 [Kappamyces sp. JEL0829]